MKKITQKIILIIGIMFSILLLNNVKAATYNVTANKTNIQVGEQVQVTVSANAGAWGITINGGGLSSSDTTGLAGQTSTTSNTNVSKTYTFTANKAGTYSIGVSGDITDYDTDQITKISKTITINVADKQTQQEPTPTTNPAKEEKKTETPPAAEPTFSNVNQTVYAVNDGINVRSSYSTSSSAVGTLRKGDSVQRIGIGSNGWSKVNFNGQTAYISSSLLTTTKPAVEEPKEEENKQENKTETSSNKALKDLVVEDYKITPDFTPENTKYSLTLKDEDDKLNIKATPEDEKAKVSITGNENFSVGNNIVKITVTAADGTTRMYTITVSKEKSQEQVDMLKLSSLKINNASLSPEFKSDVTNYEVLVDDPTTISAKDVVAASEDANVNVTVAENSKSENGEKVITIMLENEDGSKTGVYQITVRKKQSNPMGTVQNQANDNKIYYILGAIIAALLIFIVVIIVLLRKTSKEEDEDDTSIEDELSDDYDYSLKNAIDEANGEVENQYDEMAESSKARSQILNTVEYNVFKDDGASDKDDMEDYSEDLKSKKKGKHF